MTEMTWYAARTTPGAQQPRRRYRTEATALDRDGRPRGKGYKIVTTINHDLSEVEQALSDRGFTYYLPAEKRLIRDRRKTDLFKKRRFALMVGYIFVCNPHSWLELEETPGIRGVLRNGDGAPYRMRLLDILALRTMEAKAEADFDHACRTQRWKLKKKSKDDPALKRIIAELDSAGMLTVKTEELDAA